MYVYMQLYDLLDFFIYIFLPVATKSIVLDFKMMQLHFPF